MYMLMELCKWSMVDNDNVIFKIINNSVHGKPNTVPVRGTRL
jgi:hypothetical protein